MRISFSKHFFIPVWLCAIVLLMQACSEQGVQLEKQTVQFSLSASITSDASAGDIDLPENAIARISITSSNGSSVFSDREISVIKTSEGNYSTEPVELIPGSYTVTDFMILSDSVGLYVTPKKGAERATEIANALPYNFSINENGDATVPMRVTDVGYDDLGKFGYTSAKTKAKTNSLSLAVYGRNGSLTSATAELYQNQKLVNRFSLASGVNNVTLAGDDKTPYTLTVFTGNAARTETFNIKNLKKQIGKKPFSIVLQPALVFTLESYVDAGNEYEEYFEFRMDGAGAVNINWGDGNQTAANLPLQLSHEYFTGNYTAVITGDIHKVTDFAGFSYSTIFTTITGLTNLTSLKTYDPSWGAVPIKVDLSQCKKLERINVAKYGSPYEPIDLRTDFKLPVEHNINAFIFNAPSFDITREYMSEEELDAMLNNIYNNAITRQIYEGKFYVAPVLTISPAGQQKINTLISQYHWAVGFNDDIYNAEEGRSRSISSEDARREQWLKQRFSNSEQLIAKAASVVH